MVRSKIIFVGRLETGTGLKEFLRWLKSKKGKFSVDFIGDGPLRSKCWRFGRVHGFINPLPFYRKATLCVLGGYLAYLEAKSQGCKIKTFASNPLRQDYWQGIKRLKKIPTWTEVTDAYLTLYHRFK